MTVRQTNEKIPFSLISKSLNGSSKPYSLSAQSEQLERQNASLEVSVPINQSARKRLPFREKKSRLLRGLLKVLVFSAEHFFCYLQTNQLNQGSAGFPTISPDFRNISKLLKNLQTSSATICHMQISSPAKLKPFLKLQRKYNPKQTITTVDDVHHLQLAQVVCVSSRPKLESDLNSTFLFD